MKKQLTLTLCFLGSVLSFSAFAKTAVDVLPIDGAEIDRCVMAPEGAPAIKLSVKLSPDIDESIGLIKYKDTNEAVELVDGKVSLVQATVKNVLAHCGYHFADDAPVSANVIIKDFFAKSEDEKLVVGQDKANISIDVNLAGQGDQTYSFNFSLEKSFKAFASKKAKRLPKILRETLMDVMNDFALSTEFRDTMKTLGGK